MKKSRFIVFAVIIMFAVAAMGFFGTKVYAQNKSVPAFQVQPKQTQQAPNHDDPSTGADTDPVEEQVGNQNGVDTDQASPSKKDQNQGADQENAVNGSSETDGQDSASAGTPAITSAFALQAAQAYLKTTATVQLDDENGTLVYSVEFSNQEVKVDGMTGAVLGVDANND